MKDNQKNKKCIHKRIIIGIFIIIALLAANILFAVLDIYGTGYSFIHRNVTLFCMLSTGLFILAGGVAIYFLCKNKQILFKLSLSVFIFILFCLVSIFIFQKTGFFEIVKDEKSFQDYLEKAGAWMPLLYILLQYLQVVLLPIPGIVSTLAGVALFGPFKTILFSVSGIILGSFTAFFIGRKLGHKAVVWMIGEDTLNNWQKKLKGKDNIFLTFMFFMPFFPDDILCFLAGLSTISTKYFLIMIAIVRTISVAATSYSFDLIPFTTWWGLLIWGVFIIASIVAFIFIYKNLERIQRFLSKNFAFFNKRKDKSDKKK